VFTVAVGEVFILVGVRGKELVVRRWKCTVFSTPNPNLRAMLVGSACVERLREVLTVSEIAGFEGQCDGKRSGGSSNPDPVRGPARKGLLISFAFWGDLHNTPQVFNTSQSRRRAYREFQWGYPQ
jgi:hypothetical protein